tara:strand:+ start:443 stop:616 length:174 start_codon:yes stop_codon:yes gene_type:complete
MIITIDCSALTLAQQNAIYEHLMTTYPFIGPNLQMFPDIAFLAEHAMAQVDNLEDSL